MTEKTPKPLALRAHDKDGNIRPADGRFLTEEQQKRQLDYIKKVSGPEAAKLEKARIDALPRKRAAKRAATTPPEEPATVEPTPDVAHPEAIADVPH